jgi:hypothetical protein
MLTVTFVLLAAAFVCTIAAAVTPPRGPLCPLWVPVLLVVIDLLLGILPR